MDPVTLIWLALVLKLPLVAALLLVWYAVREPNPTMGEDSDGGGGSDRHHGRLPRHPRPPRRGPHVTPPSAPPRRVRIARGRKLPQVH